MAMANEEAVNSKKKGAYLGECCRCGKALFESDEVFYGKKKMGETHGFFRSSQPKINYEVDESKPLGEDLFCLECVHSLHSQEKASLEKSLEGLKKKKRRSMLYALLFGIVFFFAGVIIAAILFSSGYKEYGFISIPCTLGLGYYVFSSVYCLHAQNTFVYHAISSFAVGGFRDFPKAIIRSDASGSDVLAMKALLFIVVLLIWSVVLALLIVLILIMGVMAMVVWPYSRQKETKAIRDKYANVIFSEN